MWLDVCVCVCVKFKLSLRFVSLKLFVLLVIIIISHLELTLAKKNPYGINLFSWQCQTFWICSGFRLGTAKTGSLGEAYAGSWADPQTEQRKGPFLTRSLAALVTQWRQWNFTSHHSNQPVPGASLFNTLYGVDCSKTFSLPAIKYSQL